MMRDAANGDLDIIVPADITRYSRDGFDIINSARTLANDFNVHVVDAKGAFDTRVRQNVLTNFVHAGVAEDKRLTILENTINGRIANAANGLVWTGGRGRPVGREFDAKAKKWYITDKGRAIADILKRYLNGEDLTSLCREHGIVARSKISFWVWHSQLAGDYYAVFNQPEIGIINKKVKVPGIPEVVSPKLLARVKKRLRHNRTHNRTDAKQYRLTGFLHCACCNRAMSGKTNIYGKTLYRHHGETHEYANCNFYSVRGDQVEAQILDYLYFHFLDGAAFKKAVEQAMPSADVRKGIVNRRAMAEKRLKRKDREAANLVTAVKGGGKLQELLAAQGELENERNKLKKLIHKLDAKLNNLPDEEEIRSSAEAVRLMLYEEYQNRDWQNLPTEEIKRFLLNLFGDDDGSAGIFLRNDDQGRLVAEFKGRLVPGLRDYRELDKTVVLKMPSNTRGKAYTANTWIVPVTR
jgi:transposase-like protein